MSLMVTFKNEVIRICPSNAKKIEVSKNNGILGWVATRVAKLFKTWQSLVRKY
ncbi:hypothetical protein [Capnocytophaga gingivalis]|uniref:hypothetical protein n=1 Tax=Capnocytophaga gingivalis TaxID=1017 RepID=UPI0023F497A4|nr:hypothetical protein [Capnocytophaga gingivalis]